MQTTGLGLSAQKSKLGWLQSYMRMFLDAASLVGTMALTAGLGFVFWLVAARYYSQEAVGLASAAVSAMLLLGEIGVFGLSTMLVGQLSRRKLRPGSLISTAFLVAMVTSGLLGTLFAITAPFLSADLRPIGASASTVLLFAAGVVFISTGLILDYSTIGLERGGLQLTRNVLFAILKLGALFGAILWTSARSGLTLYATWAASAFLSVAVPLGYVLAHGITLRDLRPDWSLLGQFKGLALGHHGLNLANQAPGMFLPVLITVLLSVNVTASFYIAWMITAFVLFGPTALSITLYAASAKEPESGRSRMRLSIALSLLFGLTANIAIYFLARVVLSIFGTTYVEQAGPVLKILVATVFPHALIVHYVANARIQEKVGRAALVVGAGALVQLGLASIGSQMGGATGFSVGWLIGVCGTALITSPTIVRAAFSRTATTNAD